MKCLTFVYVDALKKALYVGYNMGRLPCIFEKRLDYQEER